MWKRLIVLLSVSSFASNVDGQRLAVEMCNQYQQDCSKPRLRRVVSGGEQARYGEFPHHALLGYLKTDLEHEYDFFCGGTLISDRHVLTAAHCFATEYPSVARLEEYHIKIKTEHVNDIPIEGYLRHPEHKFGKVYHDIALVKLEHRVYFTPSIRPACLWDSEIRNNAVFVALGFGYTGMYGDRSAKMMKVALQKFPKEDCAKRLDIFDRFDRGITNGLLCVGSNYSKRDTCEGDSGGPLQFPNPRTCIFHVVGIISTGLKGCGIGKSRAVYTKVSHYLDWIEDNVWGPNANSTDTYEAVPKQKFQTK
ncbi:serine protease snake-like [Anopheles ziemanni]|uniref:serine protease snake-like n=1 Tax=Anopheles coustani TaxID=139045 RepID=UPI0026587158|nr:serine protease snake-like [Anopheles coustani]XP_058170142.1 serine protease snake-like [Anopheles ziemanni]